MDTTSLRAACFIENRLRDNKNVSRCRKSELSRQRASLRTFLTVWNLTPPPSDLPWRWGARQTHDRPFGCRVHVILRSVTDATVRYASRHDNASYHPGVAHKISMFINVCTGWRLVAVSSAKCTTSRLGRRSAGPSSQLPCRPGLVPLCEHRTLQPRPNYPVGKHLRTVLFVSVDALACILVSTTGCTAEDTAGILINQQDPLVGVYRLPSVRQRCSVTIHAVAICAQATLHEQTRDTFVIPTAKRRVPSGRITP